MDEIIYDYAKAFIGKPYLWGGNNPLSGFDCSGLVIELLKAWGKFPDQDSNAQGLFLYYRNKGNIPSQKCDFGKLCFYGKDLNSLTHVSFGIDYKYCLTASGGGSKTLTEEDAIRQSAFVKIRPFNYRKDLKAILDTN